MLARADETDYCWENRGRRIEMLRNKRFVSIAYNTRKNSSMKTIERLVREYLGEAIDEEMIMPLAVAIKGCL